MEKLITKLRREGARRLSQDPQYRSQILSRVVSSQSRPGNFISIIKSNMNTKVLIGGFAAVAVVAVAGTAFALSRPAATNQNDNNQSNAMSLPAEKVASLNDAQSKLSYKLQLPTENLGATLSEIVVGQKTGFIDNSDTLFVSYVKNGATLFKVSNTTQEGNDPTDTKAVDLNGVAGHYYFIGEQDGAMSMGAAAAPRSYLFWKVNGVRYEVSEFGKVSEAELTQVAKSFQKLN